MFQPYLHAVLALSALYPEREARAVARGLMEDGFGVSLTDIYSGKVREFSASQRADYDRMLARLLDGEPLQYVTGTALFGPLRLHVDRGVLIPRPETEELAAWAAEEAAATARILDAGTGSGCIALYMKHACPGADVSACDLSPEALAIARDNALRLGLTVSFFRADMLGGEMLEGAPLDIIISNPPYIAESEKAGMERNVLHYEPPEALFVSDSDPLVFYRALARIAMARLAAGGRLYVEVNSRFAAGTADTFRSAGLTGITIRRDMEGRERMIRARKADNKTL